MRDIRSIPRPTASFSWLRWAIVCAATLGVPTPALHAQVQIRTGNCSPTATSLENRIACFVKVREYQDEEGLLALVAPSYVASMTTEYRARHDIFKATGGNSREARLRAFCLKLHPKDLEASMLPLYEKVFDRIESGASAREFMAPVFTDIFLWSTGSLVVKTVDSEIVSQSDSTAKLYLSQAAASALSGQDLKVERRFIFNWKRERGNWFLVWN